MNDQNPNMKYILWAICFIFLILSTNGSNGEEDDSNNLNQTSLRFSITDDLEPFNFSGIKTGIRYDISESHSIESGLKVNLFFVHTPLSNPLLMDWNTRFLDHPPYKPIKRSGDFFGRHLKFKPGLYLDYSFKPFEEKLKSFNPFLLYRFTYQIEYGEMRAASRPDPNFPMPVLSYEFEGFFYLFSNLIGVGLEYKPFDQWSFQLSSATGVGISRAYTDHEKEQDIEELLNRTFPYSQFDLGVRYNFNN